MYSLWRGDVFLGRIHPELPSDKDNAVFGMLDPAAAFLPGQALSQHVMEGWPGTPVFEHVDGAVSVGNSTRQQQVSYEEPRLLTEATHDSDPSRDVR